eukprot:s319_g10.t1
MVAFKSIFQGDHAGVEVATEAHANLLQSVGLLKEESRLVSGQPFFGNSLVEGLVIDDYFAIATVPRSLLISSEAIRCFESAKAVYSQYDLIGSDDKDVIGGAIVQSEVSREVNEVMWRSCRSKGGYSKLLDKSQSVLSRSLDFEELGETSDETIKRPLAFRFDFIEIVRRKLPLEGLQALTPEDRGLYLPDALGFAATLRDPNFRSYADLVVMPSYDTHVAGQWLGSSDSNVATPQNFLSARVFRDEAMAYAAWRYLNKDQRRGMLLIVGCDHVRYDYGIPARLKRLGSGLSRWQADRQLLLRNGPTPSAQITGRLAPGEVFSAEVEGDFLRLQGQRGFVLPEGGTGGTLGASLVEGRKLKVATVLLNPTANEGLANTGAPRWKLPSDNATGPALADYIWAEA